MIGRRVRSQGRGRTRGDEPAKRVPPPATFPDKAGFGANHTRREILIQRMEQQLTHDHSCERLIVHSLVYNDQGTK
jgi:hypothetical protein